MRARTADVKPRTRAAVETLRARTQQVTEMLFLRGFSHGRVTRECSAEWGVTPQAVRAYVRRIEAAAGKMQEDDPGITRAKLREMITSEIAEHKAAGQLKTIPSLLALLAKAEGLLDDKVKVEHEHSGTVNHVVEHRARITRVLEGASDEQLAAIEVVARRLLPAPADPTTEPAK